mmetsp:Transcript_4428/g.12558  ORF Transcript_4428/g.12558 Transcript_4428/m.12558 type:complete len:271 (+) Transcript_4428:9-821(+)
MKRSELVVVAGRVFGCLAVLRLLRAGARLLLLVLVLLPIHTLCRVGVLQFLHLFHLFHLLGLLQGLALDVDPGERLLDGIELGENLPGRHNGVRVLVRGFLCRFLLRQPGGERGDVLGDGLGLLSGDPRFGLRPGLDCLHRVLSKRPGSAEGSRTGLCLLNPVLDFIDEGAYAAQLGTEGCRVCALGLVAVDPVLSLHECFGSRRALGFRAVCVQVRVLIVETAASRDAVRLQVVLGLGKLPLLTVHLPVLPEHLLGSFMVVDGHFHPWK